MIESSKLGIKSLLASTANSNFVSDNQFNIMFDRKNDSEQTETREMLSITSHFLYLPIHKQALKNNNLPMDSEKSLIEISTLGSGFQNLRRDE
jgi:hypothetical protein